MRLLVVGGGGREHALAWKLSESPKVEMVFVTPGNPGISLEEKVRCVGSLDFPGIATFCEKEKVTFVVVGPDQALADGLVDFLEARGIATFGPTQSAARIEYSKAFSKELMKEQSIPTARFESFTDFREAEKFLRSVDWGSGWVIKADGLALGKGVVVAESREEALATARDFLEAGAMGEAGRRIVVEERLLGREVSAFFLCDGVRGVPLGFACDYKRIGDGDQGPNTGGMGAYSPADWLPEGTEQLVQEKVIVPLLAALADRKTPFKGIVFVGLMITNTGPKVIEFNARFGDPETQALLPLLAEDLLPWLQAAREGALERMPSAGPEKKNQHAVHVVMAAHGYPGGKGVVVRKGDTIRLPSRPEAKIFFAGVGKAGEDFVTAGGRVLGVTALGETRAEARALAYKEIEQVHFLGSQRRSDVGQ